MLRGIVTSFQIHSAHFTIKINEILRNIRTSLLLPSTHYNSHSPTKKKGSWSLCVRCSVFLFLTLMLSSHSQLDAFRLCSLLQLRLQSTDCIDAMPRYLLLCFVRIFSSLSVLVGVAHSSSSSFWRTHTDKSPETSPENYRFYYILLDVLNWEKQANKTILVWRELWDSSHEPKHHKKQSETCFFLSLLRRQRDFGEHEKTT